MNVCYTGVHDVRDAANARKRAIRNYISGHGRLWDEFTREYGIDILSLDVTSPEYYAKLDEFAEKRGFRIVQERPYIKFDEVEQKYMVDVSYKIEYV